VKRRLGDKIVLGISMLFELLSDVKLVADFVFTLAFTGTKCMGGYYVLVICQLVFYSYTIPSFSLSLSLSLYVPFSFPIRFRSSYSSFLFSFFHFCILSICIFSSVVM